MTEWPIREPGPVLTATVWRVDLALDAAGLDRCRAVLSDAEFARAARYARAEDRQRSIASHAALRRVLGGVLDVEPTAITFEAGPAGKPALGAPRQAGIAFNLSHSGRWALIGVAPCAIGVDVEALRPSPDCLRIARSQFAASEAAALAALPSPDLSEAFFACWTRKEAVVKATGLGLSMPLDRFAVTVPPRPAALLTIDGDAEAARRWSLYHLVPATGYVGAVALDAPDAGCLLHTLPPL